MSAITLAAGDIYNIGNNLKTFVEWACGLAILVGGSAFVTWRAIKSHFSVAQIIGCLAGVLVAALVLSQLAGLVVATRNSGSDITGVQNSGNYSMSPAVTTPARPSVA